MDILFENRFWLRILRDHLMFIISESSIKMHEEVSEAERLKGIIVNALNTLERTRNINREVLTSIRNLVMEVRALKIKLLGLQIDAGAKPEIGLPPTFINHMLNELDEYILILDRALGNDKSKPHILNSHSLWLQDATGHAVSVMSKLDPIEGNIKKDLKKHKKQFKLLHEKTHEFIQYVNRLNTNFNSIDELTLTAGDEIQLFSDLLKDILILRLGKRVLGSVQPLLINHMLREHAYYLMKIGKQVGDLPLNDSGVI